MPRRPRIVLPHYPHHITQRGARKMDVFFEDYDRLTYLNLLRENSERYLVLVLAYCLMNNHVHLILVPPTKEALSQTLKVTHMRYAHYINSKKSWSGHLWQERFFSSPLDESYFWSALRYVERNPIEVGMHEHPSEYPWSSAAAHCGLRRDELLTDDPKWRKTIASQDLYYQWLKEPGDLEQINKLRANTHRDLPCGEDTFVKKVEEETGVVLPKFRRKVDS